MSKRLLTIGAVPGSTEFVIQRLSASGTLSAHNNLGSDDFTVEIHWAAATGLRLLCSQRRQLRIWPMPSLGTIVSLNARISHGQWRDWTFTAPAVQYCGGQQVGSPAGQMDYHVQFTQHPHGYARLVSSQHVTYESKDVLVYWIPNFLFDGLLQTSRRRAGSKPDGFEFTYGANEFRFRLVRDHEKLRTAFRLRNIFCGISCIMEVRGPLCTEADPWNDVIQCLFSLMSGVEGAWVNAAVAARYNEQKQLKEVVFRSHTAAPYRSHRAFMHNFRVPQGWPKFLHTALPNFIAEAQKVNLRSVCRQLVEAQSDLTVQSSIAIALMGLEQLSTSYLASRGKRFNKAPLETKLHMCNRTLQCVPKRLRRMLAMVREELRNPLFHEGACDEPDVMALYGEFLELLNACVLLLAAICGYRGLLQLQDPVKGERVVSVDEAGQ